LWAAVIASGVVLAGAGAWSAQTTRSAPAGEQTRDQWPAYGGDPGGARHSPLTQLTPENVGRLTVAWTYRTGELGQHALDGRKLTFEATPIYFDGRLYLSTAYGKVIALAPDTGQEIWTYDAGVNRGARYSEVTSRGVAAWRDPKAAPGAPCAQRIFIGTIDARLIALDARSGQPCADFGAKGTVALGAGLEIRSATDYQVTSPPAIVHDIVVVGSSIGDNWNVDTGSGVVRGFDARTGALRWSWDPIPRGGSSGGARAGAANAWSVISVDAERDLVFVPTSSPSPDFFGGLRPGDNAHANSVVALRGSTGRLVWAFQTVHHDLWDYDLAAQPALVSVTREGRTIPAVAQATKTGSLFVLHRETGDPLFPVEERPVPRSDVPGETSWPTQPFPAKPRSLMPHGPITPGDAWGATEAERAECRAMIAKYRAGGIFTPPSLQGTIMSPGNGAGTNWGSASFDPQRQLLVLNTTRINTFVQLIPAAEVEKVRAAAKLAGEDYEFGMQRGAPYSMRRRTFESSKGMPCTAPPWGTLAAVDLSTGDVRWEIPFGQVPENHPFRATAGDTALGLPNGGGPITTASGVVFIGASMDRRLRAYDVESGRELWSAPLPRAAAATPMTYQVNGRQFIVIAAGGHGKADLEIGDFVVALALPAGAASPAPPR
jgi:quinoprotein glucose dehydrogenase